MSFNFEKYPFEKLRELLKDVSFDEKKLIDLTIGEPKFDTPKFIVDEVCKQGDKFRLYPKSAGEEVLKNAQIGFVKRRFGVELDNSELISTFGTREVLFNFPQFLLFDKPNPVMAYTNPFYQIYEGAAKASRAKIITLDLRKENDFKPQINKEVLKEVDLVILNFPNNPTGSVLDFEELKEWARLAVELDFVLLNDECYSEIWFEQKPHSILEAAIATGNSEFKNILCVNSLSKRSSAPGIRNGFISGNSEILKEYLRYRTYVGAASPVPLQLSATKAWSDEKHAEEFRKLYQKNVKIAEDIFGKKIKATFYLWLEVGDDLKVAQDLLKHYSIKTLPGSFLGRKNEGKGYLRIALVETSKKVSYALEKIAGSLGLFKG